MRIGCWKCRRALKSPSGWSSMRMRSTFLSTLPLLTFAESPSAMSCWISLPCCSSISTHPLPVVLSCRPSCSMKPLSTSAYIEPFFTSCTSTHKYQWKKFVRLMDSQARVIR